MVEMYFVVHLRPPLAGAAVMDGRSSIALICPSDFVRGGDRQLQLPPLLLGHEYNGKRHEAKAVILAFASFYVRIFLFVPT